MRCHWVTEKDGFKWFYPACWGGAVYDEEHCTCYKPIMKDKKGKRLEQTLENMESECRMLREINERLNKKNKKLERRVWEAERSGLPIKYRRALDNPTHEGVALLYRIYNACLDKLKWNIKQ